MVVGCFNEISSSVATTYLIPGRIFIFNGEKNLLEMIFVIIKNVRSHQFLPILHTDSVLQEGSWLLMKPIVARYSNDRIVRSRKSTTFIEDNFLLLPQLNIFSLNWIQTNRI